MLGARQPQGRPTALLSRVQVPQALRLSQGAVSRKPLEGEETEGAVLGGPGGPSQADCKAFRLGFRILLHHFPHCGYAPPLPLPASPSAFSGIY